MVIVPDDKDWTWVLTTPCPDCGYVGSAVDPADLAERLRANAARWRGLLDHPAAGRRPAPDVWSATEYACHVRDVFRRFAARLDLLLTEDDPAFENWDQDLTAVEDRYDRQAADVVVDELEAAGAVLADGFAAVTGERWDRTGTRSDGARFTVATLGQYLLHDPEHHVLDVQQGYAALT